MAGDLSVRKVTVGIKHRYFWQQAFVRWMEKTESSLKKAGIEDFRWHDLRHTWATWLRQLGTPTHELQRMGGWKTPAMVERYAHIGPGQFPVAAARLESVAVGYNLASEHQNDIGNISS